MCVYQREKNTYPINSFLIHPTNKHLGHIMQHIPHFPAGIVKVESNLVEDHQEKCLCNDNTQIHLPSSACINLI